MTVISNVAHAIDPRNYFKYPEELTYKEQISYKQYCFNPLSSNSPLINQTSNLSKTFQVFAKIVLAIGNIFYLPYQNIKIFFENLKIIDLNKEVATHNKAVAEKIKSKLTITKHYAKGIVKLAVFIVGTAAVIHLLGVSLLFLGEKLNSIDSLKKIATGILNSGHACKWVAKKLFLSVSVPTYALAYELPKFLIKNVPIWIEKIGTWMLTQLNRIATYISIKLIKFIEFIKPHIQKILRVAEKVIRWIGANILKPILDYSWKVISTIGNAIYDYVLEPFARIIQTLFDITQKAFSWINNILLKPLLTYSWKAIKFVCEKLYDYLLVPIGKIFQTFLDITEKAMIWFGKNVIYPILK